MQPNPTKVNNSEEKDYQTIYQDNFVKRNDPAVLGTAALNRQMSQGISNKLNGVPSMAAVTQDAACPPGMERDANGRCVLTQNVQTINTIQEQQVNPMSAQQGLVQNEINNRMLTGYGRSGDLGALEAAGVEVVGGPSLPKDDDEETDTETNITSTGGTGSVLDGINTEVDRLTGLLDDEERYLNEEFNRYYNELVRQAEGRAAREGTSPFTGGIARQIEDYMSAAEIEALGRLKMERDRQTVDLNQRRENLRTQAIRNVLEQKAGEMQTVAQNLEYTQQLAQYVIEGMISVEDALRLGDELGLGDINELMASAVKKQIAAGTLTEAEAKQELENYGFDPTIIDDDTGGGQTDTDEANIQAANDFRNELDSILENDFGDADLAAWFGTVGAAAGTGALAGAAIGAPLGAGVLSWASAGIGAAIGAVVGTVGGIVTASTTTQINQRDVPQLYNPIVDSGILTESFYNGNSESINVTKSPQANTSTNYLDDAFVVNVDGTDYAFEGADLLILASVLKRAGLSGNSQYQAIFNEANRIYERGASGIAIESLLGLKRSNAYNVYARVFNK